MEWRDLPTEIRCQIFGTVPARDHINIAVLNKESRDIAEDSVLWKQRVRQDFFGYSEEPSLQETWKSHYRRLKADQAEVRDQIQTQIKKHEDQQYTIAPLNIAAKPDAEVLLSALPHDIGDLIPIKQTILDMSSQEFSYLPASMGKLTNIWWLKLDNNKFKEFPEVISMLSKLQNVSLNHNKIKYLPDWLVNLKELKIILLKDNPLDATSVTNFLIKAPVECTIFLDRELYETIANSPEYQEVRESYSEKIFSSHVSIVRNK